MTMSSFCFNQRRRMTDVLLVAFLVLCVRIDHVLSFCLLSSNLNMKSAHRATVDESISEEPVVMVNGMPGPMATEVAIACIDRGVKLVHMGFTGPKSDRRMVEVKVCGD